VDETATLLSLFFPVDLPFGAYTAFMGMAYAGTDASNTSNWASAVAQATVTYDPLSPVQRSILQSRGNPDVFAAFWFPDQLQKHESWVYLSSGIPTRYRFLNGNLQSQQTVENPGGGAGPKVDPGHFSPHTTLDQLTATFGPPSSIAADEDIPEFQGVTYSFGLDVTLLEGRLSSATTSLP
jgi:hypothetical protein